MYFVYVLKSEKNGNRYVGFTGKKPELRVHEHNSGMTQSTRVGRPYSLVYREEFEDKKEAIKREKFLKSGQGRKFLDQTIPP